MRSALVISIYLGVGTCENYDDFTSSRVKRFPLEPEPVGEEAVERTDGRTSRTGRMAGWMMRAGSGRVTLHRNTSMTLWFPATSTSVPHPTPPSTRPNFPLIPICFTYANKDPSLAFTITIQNT